MQRFTGKVAIITGAGQGIGQGIAARLAREGATVYLADYNEDTAGAAAQAITAAGGQAHPYRIDITDVAAVSAMVDAVVAAAGHIDILVNNAGVVQTKPMLNLTETDWDWVNTVNQRGTFFVLQAVAAQMTRQMPEAARQAAEQPADIVSMQSGPVQVVEDDGVTSYGKIVNMSSISGRRGRPLSTHYAATKAAIISLTQSAALALAPYRILVNAVCPGIVPTPMWQQIDEDRGRLFGAQPGQAMNAFINTVPLKRAATAEDVAGAVTFFCSADADYITGQTLNVDGGYEMD